MNDEESDANWILIIGTTILTFGLMMPFYCMFQGDVERVQEKNQMLILEINKQKESLREIEILKAMLLAYEDQEFRKNICK